MAAHFPDQDVDKLQQEHTVVLQMWGRLQQRLSAQLQQHAAEQARYQAEVMRLRAALLLTRTAVWWGMSLTEPLPMRRAAAPGRRQGLAASANRNLVDDVLCQTACVGHAHHWLDDDERCTRTGQPCHRVAPGE